MPPGDLITGDYQVEIRDLLIGPVTTQYVIEPPGIGGLGVPPTKEARTSFEGRSGSFAGPEFRDVRQLTIPVGIWGDDAEDAMTLLAALNTAFLPCTDGVDIELHLQLPGWGHLYLEGRPGMGDPDMSNLKSGEIGVLCRFDGMNPTFQAFGS